MNSIGERELRNISAALILGAVKSIKKGRINLQQDERPDKDLKWLHDPDSDFKVWCEYLDLCPEKFRKKYPLSLASGFYRYERIQKGTKKAPILA